MNNQTTGASGEDVFAFYEQAQAFVADSAITEGIKVLGRSTLQLKEKGQHVLAAGALSGAIVLGANAAPASAAGHNTEAVVHEVEHGDTLSDIAARNGVSVTAVLAANPDIANPDLIKVGQNITVGCEPGAYLAKPGDTATKIANQHGMSVEAFAEQNSEAVKDINKIYAGTCYDVSKPENVVPVTVEPGFTVSEIAKTISEFTGIDAQELQTQITVVNELDEEATIYAGEQLDVPLPPAAPEVLLDAAAPEAPVEPEPQLAITEGAAVTVPEPIAVVSEVAAPAPVLRYENIPETKPGVDPALVQEAVRYMVEKHGASPLAAAYLAGNFLQESSLNPSAYNAGEGAMGIGQWRFERKDGLPAGDIYAQIDFAFFEMTRDPISRKHNVLGVMTDQAATPEAVRAAMKEWTRWGEEANRMVWGQQIYEALTAPAPISESTPAETAEAAPAPPQQEPPAEAIATEVETVPTIPVLSHPLITNKEPVMQDNGVTTVEVLGEPVNIEIAGSLARMLEHARTDGVELILLDAFRSNADQIRLREANDCPDLYESPPSSCRVPTALPGHSNHQDGTAIDFRYMQDGVEMKIENHSNPAFEWLERHGPEYGFYNLPSEPWHWSLSGR